MSSISFLGMLKHGGSLWTKTNGRQERSAALREQEILPPLRRSEIARQAAITRWAEGGRLPPILAKYGALDRPLRIGEIEIPCYVLADGTRVLAQRGLQSGIGLSEGGGKSGARRIAELMANLAEKDIDVRGLVARASCRFDLFRRTAEIRQMVTKRQSCRMFAPFSLRLTSRASLASIVSIWPLRRPSYSMASLQSELLRSLTRPPATRIIGNGMRSQKSRTIRRQGTATVGQNFPFRILQTDIPTQ